MSRRTINNKEADTWRELATSYRIASEALDGAVVYLLDLKLKHGVETDALLARLDAARDAVNGEVYMHMPQSEWTGGDSFVVKEPHAANYTI